MGETFIFKSTGQALIFITIQKGIVIPVESRETLITMIDEAIDNAKHIGKEQGMYDTLDKVINQIEEMRG